ncbi:5-methylcytosine restriction system specificity protein McrC [Fictibacillus fluitans]|uniref:Restriction endonuclease n=1 Tax=Fictibacillus fluitans TaxID=3058422 RepID=A0ABT8HYU5_9BACL|nr:restriction endonuclease [Fictibacillus sp. NE201]MDN4525956.1 restriction endonuclease [Fictibacillus sp. NE201]
MNSLPDSSKIPIKNVYYMLCYAWGHLSEKGLRDVWNKDDSDINNLLTRILLNKLNILIKKGYYREYQQNEDEASLLRGKIRFKESITSGTMIRGKMYFEYEELSHDIPHNQIIKTVLYSLGKSNKLNKELKWKVVKILPYFEGIKQIKLNIAVFNNIKIHRNNHHYGFIIDICQFLFESLLIHENGNRGKFADFDQNPKAMAYLFEEFVRSFYKNELEGYKVSRENIYWDALGDNLEMLPLMQTDISLENKTEKIIMDTKYYQSALATNRGGSEKLISNNLYQMYAYLNNYKNAKEQNLRGILVYPKVDRTLNLSYSIGGFRVKIFTVDLNAEWRSIHTRLLGFIEETLQ